MSGPAPVRNAASVLCTARSVVRSALSSGWPGVRSKPRGEADQSFAVEGQDVGLQGLEAAAFALGPEGDDVVAC